VTVIGSPDPSSLAHRALAAARRRTRSRRKLLAVAATLLVLVGAGAAQGAYFPGSWGWLALACAWIACLAAMAGDTMVGGRSGAAFVVGATGLGAWTLASALWSSDVTTTGLEAQRALVVVAAVLALVAGGRGTGNAMVRGAWGAASLLCGYGLLTRVLPERLGVNDALSGYRLSQPIGYWNALGLLAAMGLLLGLGLAARSRSLALRAASSASLVPLALTLYFTFSRGAWIALAGGTIVLLLLDRARVQLITVLGGAGAWAAAAVLVASRQQALVTAGAALAQRSHQGHRLLAVVIVLGLGSASTSVGLAMLARRMRPTRRVQTVVGAALVACTLGAAAAAIVAYGAPWTIAARGWKTFSSTAPVSTPDLNSRLFHLSGSGRVAQWRVAWQEVESHPVLGSGAGTYEIYWNRDRHVGLKVRDVHNLYLETLAEVGPFGLALLLTMLGAPLVAAFRARRRALGATAAAAYASYLAHAAVDWDWEICSVTLTALVCGGALISLAASTRPTTARDRAPRTRRVMLALAVLLAGASLFVLAGRIEIHRESSAAASGNWVAAAHAARHASSLQPWSAEPWQLLAESELRAGRLEAARADLERALTHGGRDWQLWLDLARASDGRARVAAMNRVRTLNPLSPELAAYVASLTSLSIAQTAPP
jgi:hypothetical protein